ncbi:patatin-like phospholipase family protein [Nocardia sp. NPDC004582]
MSDHDLGVGELIARRHREDSAPGRRTDRHRLALVIEGGSSRGAYSHGMAMAIEELGVLSCFDAVYGASAGALNAAWLLCGRAVDSRRAWNPEVINRVISPARALRGGKVVDTDYLVHTVYERIVPMDFPAILANAITFHPIATDADTGAAVDLHPELSDVRSVQTALRASTCLPILAGRPVRIGARRFVDAGLSESVPVRTALAQGATRVLVLRTRRNDEAMRPRRRWSRGWWRASCPGTRPAPSSPGSRGSSDITATSAISPPTRPCCRSARRATHPISGVSIVTPRCCGRP